MNIWAALLAIVVLVVATAAFGLWLRARAGVLKPIVSARAHVEVDLASRPDLARRFNILSTPTTLVLDGAGVSVARITGAPRPAELAHQLAHALGATNVA